MRAVRPAVPRDLRPIARALAPLPLLARYGQTAEHLETGLSAALCRTDGVLVCDDEEGPCGLAWFLRSGTFAMGGYLRLIAVAVRAQGTGVGAALLGAFEQDVYEASQHAFLLVSDFNLDARRFYERHGYRQVGAMADLVLAGVAELIYWKPRPPVAAGRG